MDLRAYLTEKKIAPAEFAGSIKVTPASLYRYLARERRPSWDILARIAKQTGGKVQPNDFLAPAAPAPSSSPSACAEAV